MRLSGYGAGISKIAIAVVLVVAVALAGAFLILSGGSSTTTQTSASTSQPSSPVKSAVDQLLQDINSRNVDGLANFYAQDSVAVWSGSTGGLSGMYTGTSNIKLIYATTVGKTNKMGVNSSQYAEKVFSATHINTTYVLHMLGNSTAVGKLNATINISQEWNWRGGGWQISKENWNYQYFDASLLDLRYGSATTFPQWGVMQAGGNPNLISEKSLEWHAGPFLAVGVYAFLFSIVVVTATRLLSRNRTR